MYGEGLLKGLRVTFRHFFGKAITEQYPERRPKLPPRTHCSFKLSSEKCSGCGSCALSCPNNVISVETFRDENKKRHVTGFRMELMYCLFCGLCVESCPSSALKFTDDFELSSYNRDGMVLKLYNNPPAVGEKENA